MWLELVVCNFGGIAPKSKNRAYSCGRFVPKDASNYFGVAFSSDSWWTPRSRATSASSTATAGSAANMRSLSASRPRVQQLLP
jgi:hypothetical protein